MTQRVVLGFFAHQACVRVLLCAGREGQSLRVGAPCSAGPFLLTHTLLPPPDSHLLVPTAVCRILVDLYGPCTSSSNTNGSSGSSGSGVLSQQQQHQASAQSLEAWKAGIASTRRTKTVRQKWQELLLSVQGECVRQ